MAMKPLPAPPVPGSTESERMDNAVRKMFSVSKDAFNKEEVKYQREKLRKKRVNWVAKNVSVER
jgi:hypothetical protein